MEISQYTLHFEAKALQERRQSDNQELWEGSEVDHARHIHRDPAYYEAKRRQQLREVRRKLAAAVLDAKAHSTNILSVGVSSQDAQEGYRSFRSMARDAHSELRKPWANGRATKAASAVVEFAKRTFVPDLRIPIIPQPSVSLAEAQRIMIQTYGDPSNLSLRQPTKQR